MWYPRDYRREVPKVDLRSANTNPNPAPRQPPSVSQMRPEPQDDNSKAWNLSKPDDVAEQKDMQGGSISDDQVLEHIRRAWNTFVKLKQTGHHDLEEFHEGIHRLQSIMALRQCRRTNPERWPVTAGVENQI